MAQGTFHIITFGCQMNVNDSFWLARSLQRRGFVESPLEKAEVVILNTCSVRDKPEQKVYAALGRIKYETRRVPGSFAVVAGCVAQQIGAGFFERFPQVRLVVGGDGLAMAPDAIERLHGDPSLRLNLTDFSEIYPERDPALPAQGEGEIPPVAFVNIMQGCDNFCTYCIVPYVRGRERSRTPEDILAEVRKLAADGVKEVMLLGQNVNSYGKNLENPVSFAELLRMVNEVEGIERIRFMTSHPKDMSDELILAMKECDKVCKNLHLPFQSGSTEILKKMNRHYTKEGYLELVRKVREAMPEITLSTDIIVGFPGETEEDFQETLDVIRKARYCTAFTFIYSKRTGTPAAKMENQVPEDVVKDRFDRMLQVLNPIVHEVTEEQVGKVLPVLVEEVSKHDENILTGRTEQNTLVHFSGGKDLIGQMVPVKIIENKTFYVIGERI